MARVKRGAVDTHAADDVLESVLSREEQLLNWFSEQRQTAITMLIAAALIAAGCVAGWLYMRRQSGAAGARLAEALDDYHGKIQADPGKPGEKVFKTDAERLDATAAALDQVINGYPMSDSAAEARLLKVALLAERGQPAEAYKLAGGLSVSGDPSVASRALQAVAELAPLAGLPDAERDAAVKTALERAIALNGAGFPAPAARLALADYYIRKGDAASLKIAREQLAKVKSANDDQVFPAKADEKLRTLDAAPAA